MPLMKSSSKKAMSKNIETEMKAGKPQKQAIAIAYATKRATSGKKKMANGGMTTGAHSLPDDERVFDREPEFPSENPDNWRQEESEYMGDRAVYNAPIPEDKADNERPDKSEYMGLRAMARGGRLGNPKLEQSKLEPPSEMIHSLRMKRKMMADGGAPKPYPSSGPSLDQDKIKLFQSGSMFNSAGKKKMARGGLTSGSHSLPNDERVYDEEPAYPYERDDDNQRPEESEYMALRSTPMDRELSSAMQDKADNERPDKDEYMGRRAMSHGGDIDMIDSIRSKRKRMAKGGLAEYSDQSGLLPYHREGLEDNAQEHPDYARDTADFEAIEKELYPEKEALDALDGDYDSNLKNADNAEYNNESSSMHGDDDIEHDKYDAVDSIRKRMKSKR